MVVGFSLVLRGVQPAHAEGDAGDLTARLQRASDLEARASAERVGGVLFGLVAAGGLALVTLGVVAGSGHCTDCATAASIWLPLGGVAAVGAGIPSVALFVAAQRNDRVAGGLRAGRLSFAPGPRGGAMAAWTIRF
jgi:hypothetical protein